MKKEYIAFYENDLLEYYPKNKQLDDYKFESRIIDDEMWFVMLSDEDVRCPASVVFADDDWIVIPKFCLGKWQIRDDSLDLNSNDYKKEYETFWKDIVENEDGTINKEQLMKELSDMSMLIKNCSQAYYCMSCGVISKPNTDFSAVEDLFRKNYLDTAMIQDDLRDMVKECETLSELKFALIDYFELEGN